jgi:hypothetical protein
MKGADRRQKPDEALAADSPSAIAKFHFGQWQNVKLVTFSRQPLSTGPSENLIQTSHKESAHFEATEMPLVHFFTFRLDWALVPPRRSGGQVRFLNAWYRDGLFIEQATPQQDA